MSGKEIAAMLPWLMRADALVGVSQAVMAPLLKAGVPDNKMHLIHNGLDFEMLKTTQNRGVIHNELKLPASVRLIGVIGRVVPEKGIEEFIEAVATVSHKVPDVHFLIIGEDENNGNYIRRLKHKLLQIGLDSLITFTGFRTDIPDVLEDLDLLVLPSRSDMPEGLPNSILEALATGLLTVATRNSGVPEVIVDGVNGFLVDCDDVQALAVAMEQALTLSEATRCEMSEKAKRSVQNRTMENQMLHLANLYRTLLCSRPYKSIP